MPRIKSPISSTERSYNLRYEEDTQRTYYLAVSTSDNSRNFDTTAREIMRDIRNRLDSHIALSEKQADWLADMYNKYSE